MPSGFEQLAIPGVYLIKPEVHEDARGHFVESYRESVFSANGISSRFVQQGQSKSVRSVLRGLHFQRQPKAQGKLVRAINGEIFDVAVDIRKNSPTYGRWVGAALSAQNMHALYIPIGFAHGFCALSETADVLYSMTEEYSPEHDAGIAWDDPAIGIDWPIEKPILSKKDLSHPNLSDADTSFVYEDPA
ncbi:MAG: dTDP-4-dehydrorhamnose 3,5-epimerase [Elusimicrobia bacterium]|nr:MAG: dTDP-4-dehydrorhamnose 3,5-epimerase [Elusimicrobiota bacterium]